MEHRRVTGDVHGATPYSQSRPEGVLMSVETGGHRETAIGAVAERQYERAGDEYTRAGWHILAELRDGQDPFEADEKGWVGRGLRSLATATVAYRVAGVDHRPTHRAVEGIALARDLQSVLDAPAQNACLLEFVADFRALGGMDDVSEAYDDAETAYMDAGADVASPQTAGMTPLFEAAAGTLKQVARSTADGEIAVAWEDLHGSDPESPGRFLAHRARFKRQRFPTLIQQVVEDGYLAAPRGTTEYGSANYICPNCDSSDTNWTSNNTVCLRCSTPMNTR